MGKRSVLHNASLPSSQPLTSALSHALFLFSPYASLSSPHSRTRRTFKHAPPLYHPGIQTLGLRCPTSPSAQRSTPPENRNVGSSWIFLFLCFPLPIDTMIRLAHAKTHKKHTNCDHHTSKAQETSRLQNVSGLHAASPQRSTPHAKQMASLPTQLNNNQITIKSQLNHEILHPRGQNVILGRKDTYTRDTTKNLSPDSVNLSINTHFKRSC